MKIYYNKNLKHLSRELRKRGTLSETLLWNEIKSAKLKGYRFARQKPIGAYIVDFYCPRLKFAIEVDGISHDAKIEQDDIRQKEIENLGISFLRFNDSDVKQNLDSVVREIIAFMEEKETTPAPKTEAPPLLRGNPEADCGTI